MSAPGVSFGFGVTEVPVPFDIRRYRVHDPSALVGGEPLTIQSTDNAWSYVVSFPPREDAVFPPAVQQAFGWIIRVTGQLVSGCATLAHATADLRVCDEVPLTPGTSEHHALLEPPASGAQILVRHGGESGTIRMQIDGFTCSCLTDDGRSLLLSPPQLALAPLPHWSRFYGNTFHEIGERVRHLRFRTLDEPRLMKWFEGLEVLVVPGEQVSQAVYVSGLYEPSTSCVLRQILHEGHTFVDVGANVGLFTMLASRWVGRSGRVIAFEPSGREFARLRHHVDHNALSNVLALQTAAGDCAGTAVLHVADARYSGLNTIENRFMYDDVVEACREVVPVVEIDDVVRRHGVPRVHAMKIDVEGAEHKVIAGARQTIARDLPVLILEVAGAAQEPRHQGRTSVEAFLRSLGYGFAAIDGDTGALRRTADLKGQSENFLAATLEVLAALSASPVMVGR